MENVKAVPSELFGESTEVLYYESISHSPAWTHVGPALAELEAAGLVETPNMGPQYNDTALVLVDSDLRCYGFLSYRYDATSASLWILTAYTVPSCRRLGVHTRLFNALVERAKAHGNILSIKCGTHVNNKVAQVAFAAQGRKCNGLLYTYEVTPAFRGKPAASI